jgi:LPXTG-site transpeptidase (sortase) family protein
VGLVQPPTLSKSFTPTTMWVGQVSQLAIVIRNNDLSTALTQASITDNLPAGVTLASPVSPTLTNCGGSASLTAVSGTGTVTLSNSTIAANTSCTIRVNVTSASQGAYTNTIPTGALQTQQGGTNGSPATAPLNVQAVGISKAFLPASFQAGGTSTLTITLQNPTGSAYTGVNLSDTLPGTVLTVVNGSAATTCGGAVSTTLPRTVSLTGGTIPSGSVTTPGTCTITVQVTAPAGALAATYTNTIPAGALTTNQPGVTNVIPATAQVRVYANGTGVTGNKSFSPSTIAPGGNSRLRINITAPADTNLTNFSINDALPLNVTISNSTAATTSGCGAGSILTHTTGAASISLTNGTILAGTTCQINVYVTSSVANVYTNTIHPADITDNENRTTTGNINATLTVRAASPLSMSKAFTPSTIIPNGISTLTITLQNTDVSRLVNVSVTDTLPGNTVNGVVVAPTPNASTTCGSGVVTAAAGTQTITMTGGIIPAQVGAIPGVCTITVDVQGKGSAATRTNTIPILNVSGTIEGTATTVNPTAAASAPLTIANLSIGVVKGFDPLTVFGGSASTLSVQLVNPNNVALSGIALTDSMPSGMIIANPANLSVGTCGGSLSGAVGADTFSFSGGSLPATGTCTLTLSVTMTVNGNLTNVIPAGAVTTSSGATNPQPAAASLTNLPGASISKFFSPNPITAGDFSLLTITIQNTGDIPLSGMGMSDALPGTLPAGLEIAGPPAPGPVNNCGGTFTATAGTQTMTLTNGVLAASASCTIVVSVTGTTPGDYQNIIPTGNLRSNEGATNNLPATDTLTITAAPTAAIGDFVWNDINADGIQDAGEPGISNVTVHLLDSGGNVIDTTTTDVNGKYAFTNLQPGTYGIEFVPPAGYTVSPADQGADAADSDANVVTGRTGNYTLAAGETNNTVDAGMHQQNTQNGMTKVITDTSQPSTLGTNVAIGEIVTYQSSASLPPGTYDSAQLIDTMDKGLAFAECVSITADPGLSTSNPGGFDAVCATPTVQTFPGGSVDPADVDRRAIFDFGTLTNNGNSAATLTVTYRAAVIDSSGNLDGVNLNNSVTLVWNGGSLGPASTTVHVVEPKLSITKTSNNAFVAVGSNLTFTLTLQHTAASHTDAFDVTVDDPLPVYLDIVPGSLDCTTGAQDPTSCTYNNVTRTISAHWDTFTLLGGNGVIQFHTITASLPGSGGITNVGTADWSSLPGDFTQPQSFTPNILSTERFYDPLSSINVYGANARLLLTPLGAGGGGGNESGRRSSESRVGGSGVIIPITGFAPGKITDLSGLPVTSYDASNNLTLEIPKLKINMAIVGVPLNKGTWDVNSLLNQAGWLEHTAFPGFTGNSVLTSHVTFATGGPGPFSNLSSLSPGDLVFVHAFGQMYIYEVRSNQTVKPNDISVFRHEEKAWLTLITCGNYDETQGIYLNRVVVRAKLIQTQAEP